MTCFKPLKCFKSAEVNPSGKRSLVFNPLKALNSALPLHISCGLCVGCRLARTNAWSVRLQHETLFHDSSCAVTLTFRDDNYPLDGSFTKAMAQKFMERLRNSQKAEGLGKVRFYLSTEYAPITGRAHAHAIVYGEDFSQDRMFYKMAKNKTPLWKSERLHEIWPHGDCVIGTVTMGTCKYVAGYIIGKKIGPPADEHYTRPHPLTGELVKVEPEFSLMSRRPGIGAAYVEKYGDQLVGGDDFVVIDDQKLPVPSYYSRRIERKAASVAERIRRKRKLAAAQPKAKAERTPERLAVREEVRLRRIQRRAFSLR